MHKKSIEAAKALKEENADVDDDAAEVINSSDSSSPSGRSRHRYPTLPPVGGCAAAPPTVETLGLDQQHHQPSRHADVETVHPPPGECSDDMLRADSLAALRAKVRSVVIFKRK